MEKNYTKTAILRIIRIIFLPVWIFTAISIFTFIVLSEEVEHKYTWQDAIGDLSDMLDWLWTGKTD